MIVLHAHWQPPTQRAGPAAFRFWAETADAPPPAKRSVQARKTSAHPFAARAGVVRSLLRRLAAPSGLPLLLDAESSAALLLPSGKTGPLPSPALLHEWDLAGAGEPMLAAWEMPACEPDLVSAAYIFASLPGDAELPPSLRLGEDVRFGQAAVHFVLELLAQQKVLPALVQEGERAGGLAARWRLLADGPRDAPRLAQLGRAMPPLCRAHAPGAAGEPPDSPQPNALVAGCLDALTDALARRWSRAAAARVQRGVGDGLLLPGLGQPLQACGGRPLYSGRTV